MSSMVHFRLFAAAVLAIVAALLDCCARHMLALAMSLGVFPNLLCEILDRVSIGMTALRRSLADFDILSLHTCVISRFDSLFLVSSLTFLPKCATDIALLPDLDNGLVCAEPPVRRFMHFGSSRSLISTRLASSNSASSREGRNISISKECFCLPWYCTELRNLVPEPK